MDSKNQAVYFWFEENMICPICKRRFDDGPDRLKHGPFCSARCRTVDLGNWLDGAYRIAAQGGEEDLDGSPPPDDETPSPKN